MRPSLKTSATKLAAAAAAAAAGGYHVSAREGRKKKGDMYVPYKS